MSTPTATRKYEATYILDPTLPEETLTGLVEKFTGLVTNESAEGEDAPDVKNLGRRRLTYEIKGKYEGYYISMRFDTDTARMAELRRQLTLSDEVLRSLLLNLS